MMNLIKVQKNDTRNGSYLPSRNKLQVSIWTPWLTILVDFGVRLYGAEDELGLDIIYEGWGPIFYFGNRDVKNLGNFRKMELLHFLTLHPEYRIARKGRIVWREKFEKTQNEIRLGNEPHPVMMTPSERHDYTVKRWMEAKGYKWDGKPLTDEKMKEMGRMPFWNYREFSALLLSNYDKKYGLEYGSTGKAVGTGETWPKRISE